MRTRELVHVAGLGQEPVRHDRGQARPGRRRQDHPDGGGVLVAHAGEQRDAVHRRHLLLGDEHVHRFPLRAPPAPRRRRARTPRATTRAGGGERLLQVSERVRLVVDEQDPLGGRLSGGAQGALEIARGCHTHRAGSIVGRAGVLDWSPALYGPAGHPVRGRTASPTGSSVHWDVPSAQWTLDGSPTTGGASVTDPPPAPSPSEAALQRRRSRHREPHRLSRRVLGLHAPAVGEHVHDLQPTAARLVGARRAHRRRARPRIGDLDADLARRAEDRDVEARPLVTDAVGRQLGDHQLHRLQGRGGTGAQRVGGEPARRMNGLRNRGERPHASHEVAPSFSARPMATITRRSSGRGSRSSNVVDRAGPPHPQRDRRAVGEAHPADVHGQ